MICVGSNNQYFTKNLKIRRLIRPSIKLLCEIAALMFVFPNVALEMIVGAVCCNLSRTM